MSFVVGQKYRCVKASASLTVGKEYECLRYTPPSPPMCGTFSTHDDRGGYSMWDDTRFDPNPPMPSSIVASHVAATQSMQQQLNRIAASVSGGTVCSCGKQAEKRVFSTFEYMYCSTCKKEVGGKAEPGPFTTAFATQVQPLTVNHVSAALQAIYGTPTPTNTSQQLALPLGIAALNGEALTCANCGQEHDYLNCDLPVLGDSARSPWRLAFWFSLSMPLIVCCSNPAISRLEKALARTEYHIKGRGWV